MRVSFSHVGGVCVAPESQLTALLVVVRVMNSTEPPGCTSRMTSADPAVSDPRSITPALAWALVFWMLATRATMETSPVIGCITD